MIVKYKIEPTKENLPTLRVDTASGQKYIHSRHFPSKEHITFPEFQSDTDCIIVLGLGLGHHIAKKQYDTNKNYILIDVIKNIEEETLKIYHELKQKNINIFTGDEKQILHNVETFFKESFPSKIQIIEHAASIRAFPQEYDKLKLSITSLINSIAGNIATKNLFSGIYLRNIIRRLPDLGEYYPVSSLTDRFKNIPAMIISSAPSLDANISAIAAGREKMILIAVDSALPALIKREIIPDFVVSIDPQPWITEHLQDFKNDFMLIESISSFNTNMKQPKFISLNSHPISQIIEHFYPGKTGSTDSKTGTVAGDAINAAMLMGCSPILITGMDFSFPDFNIYARGTSYQRRFGELFNNRLTTVEKLNANYIFKKSGGFKFNGINSRKSFIDYKNRLDIYLSKSGKEFIHIINKSIALDVKVINNCSQIINNFSELNQNKKKLLTKLITDSPQLKDIINIKKLNSFIAEDNNFKEICTSSEISNDRKISKYRKLQEKLCESA